MKARHRSTRPRLTSYHRTAAPLRPDALVIDIQFTGAQEEKTLF